MPVHVPELGRVVGLPAIRAHERSPGESDEAPYPPGGSAPHLQDIPRLRLRIPAAGGRPALSDDRESTGNAVALANFCIVISHVKPHTDITTRPVASGPRRATFTR